MNTYCELSASHKCENEAGLKHFIKHGVIQGCAGCCRFCMDKDTCEHRCAYVKDTPEQAQETKPAAFDFSALGDLAEQAVETDQQFDLHYGTAQDEYLISCIYVAKMHALTAKAGRYGGGTWTKWYESKGLGEGSVRRMIQNGEAFKSANMAELKQLPELTRKDLNLIARSGCAEQLTAAAGDSQRVQELLAQIKAEKERADAAETREEEARKAAHEYHEKYEEAAAMRATLLDQQGVYIADIDGLKKQNAKLQQSYHDADEGRIAARLQCQKAEGERDRAEERAKDAENQLAGSRQMAEAAKLRADKLQEENAALKKQPIAAVVDEEEVDRRAHQQAYSIAADMTTELKADKDKLTKDNAALRKQLAALRAKAGDDAQADFESANFCVSLIRSAWDANKASYSRLTGEDLESTFQALCGVLNGVMEEASRLLQISSMFESSSPRQQDIPQELPPSLLYAAAKPSAPPELVEQVKSGDITSFEEYQELLAQVKAKDDAIAAEKSRADTAEAHLEAGLC